MYPFIILNERYDIISDVSYDSLVIISAIYRIVFRKLHFSLTPLRSQRFISLINRRARGDRKGFGNSFHINALSPLPSAFFAPSAVYI